MSRRGVRIGAAFASVALFAAACGGDDGGSSNGGGPAEGSLEGQTIEVAAVWTGAEQESFRLVLDAFEERTGAEVQYTSTGDDIATVLNTRLQGGSPPDVAILPQPGLLRDLAEQDALVPVNDAVSAAVDENFAGIWRELGSVDGELYGVYWKAANKSLVWYNTEAFDDAGVEAPETWEDFTTVVSTLSDAGITPLSIAGGDGWTLTDWFENVYLRVAGPEAYDQLASHEIPWTDQTVIDTLTILSELWSMPNAVSGGPEGALQITFQQSVADVFSDDPQAAIVFEGDFVASVINAETSATVGENAQFFTFPSINGSPTSVVAGGDVAVALQDNEGAHGLLEFLASPEAAEIWAAQGGFLSPNQNVDLSVYPDESTQQIAQALIDAGDNVRYDMSDLQPAAFGATPSAGMWGILQDFLANPTDIQGTAQALEEQATAAYGG